MLEAITNTELDQISLVLALLAENKPGRTSIINNKKIKHKECEVSMI